MVLIDSMGVWGVEGVDVNTNTGNNHKFIILRI